MTLKEAILEHLKFKLKTEDDYKYIYELDINEIIFDNSIFNFKNKIIVNFCKRLLKFNLTFQELIETIFGEHKCHCGNNIKYTYSRKVVSISKFCCLSCSFNTIELIKLRNEKKNEQQKRICKCCNNEYIIS